MSLKTWAAASRAVLRRWKARAFADQRQTLAVMALMKNEALNVDEWIDHYIAQGADHLFIIDNGSTDEQVARIMASAHREKITVLSYPARHQQSDHYRRALRSCRIRKRFRWLLVVDADEFCFAKAHATLPEALRALEWYDVIYMQWTYFGCKGQIEHPQSLRRDLVWRHAELGSHFNSKWFAKTDVLRGKALAIHKVRGADSARTITANDVFQLNHYQTQSFDFWTKVKMTRGDAALSANEYGRTIAAFDDFNDKAVVPDHTLADRLAQSAPVNSTLGTA